MDQYQPQRQGLSPLQERAAETANVNALMPSFTHPTEPTDPKQLAEWRARQLQERLNQGKKGKKPQPSPADLLPDELKAPFAYDPITTAASISGHGMPQRTYKPEADEIYVQCLEAFETVLIGDGVKDFATQEKITELVLTLRQLTVEDDTSNEDEETDDEQLRQDQQDTGDEEGQGTVPEPQPKWLVDNTTGRQQGTTGNRPNTSRQNTGNRGVTSQSSDITLDSGESTPVVTRPTSAVNKPTDAVTKPTTVKSGTTKPASPTRAPKPNTTNKPKHS